MRYETWVKKFHPIKNHLTMHTAIDGHVFLPQEDDLAFVQQQPRDRVWSFIVSDEKPDTVWLISDGFHIVNVMGYLVTRKAFNQSRFYTIRY